MSIEPWNTATDGRTGCEDMPRKSVDIKLTDYPVSTEKGQLRPFPTFRRGRVRAEPDNRILGVSSKPKKCFSISISAIFHFLKLPLIYIDKY